MPSGFWSRVISYSNGYPEDDDPHHTNQPMPYQHQPTYSRSHPNMPDPEFSPFSGQPGYLNESHSYDPAQFDPSAPQGDKLEFKYEGPVQTYQQRGDPLAIPDASSFQTPEIVALPINGNPVEYAMNPSQVMSAVSPFEDDMKPEIQGKGQQGSWYLNNQSLGNNLDYNRNYWQTQAQPLSQPNPSELCTKTNNAYQELAISQEFAHERHRKSSEEPLNLSALPNLDQAHGTVPYRQSQPMSLPDPTHMNDFYENGPKFSSNNNHHLQDSNVLDHHHPHHHHLRNKHFLTPYCDEHERHLVTPGLGHSSKMASTANHVKGPKEKTMQYMLRRERNNIAVRKSREKAKRSFEELVRKEKFLKERNASLELKLAKLSRDVIKLRGYYRSLKEAGMVN